jgi:hypothetical protein
MDGTLRTRLLPMVVLVLFCAAPTRAEAQHFVCRPIVRGDTASDLARRLRGNPAAAYSDTFQIRDPARRLFVPKSQYRDLSPRWQVCIADGPAQPSPAAYVPVVAAAATARPGSPPSDRPQHDRDVITQIAYAVGLTLLICGAVGVLLAPHPMPPVLQRAGQTFAVAFARPLIDSSSPAPPIQVRLRFIRRSQRLEISIAPGPGRRYPNLVDHKKNVEYDVRRVMRVLGNHFVVSDRLRAAGHWVVVPIRVADVKQTGVQ